MSLATRGVSAKLLAAALFFSATFGQVGWIIVTDIDESRGKTRRCRGA
jgi:hypothetical protein